MRAAHLEKVSGCHQETSVGSLFHYTPALMAKQTHGAAIARAHWIALHPPRRRNVRAAFSARWLCYMLNSARSTSMLSLR